MRKVILVVFIVLAVVSVFGSLVGDLHKWATDAGFEVFTYSKDDDFYIVASMDGMDKSVLMMNYEDQSFSLSVNLEPGQNLEAEFLGYVAIYKIPVDIFKAFIKLEEDEQEFIKLNGKRVGVMYSKIGEYDMMVVQENEINQ